MPVLAGVVSFTERAALDLLCSRMLEAQAEYASGVMAQKRLGAAAFAGPSADSVLATRRQCQQSDARWLIVADVRLDNHRELISKLGMRSLPVDRDDVATLRAAWIAWGPECFDALVGEYAFAIYDVETETLVLARDCSGERPLF